MTTKEMQETFEKELLETLTEVITSYNIPTAFKEEKESGKHVTLFVNRSPNEKPSRSKKKKNFNINNVEISYSLARTFNLSEILSTDHRPLSVYLIYLILDADYVQSSISRLMYWSKPLFNSVSKMFDSYGIKLSLLPLEVYFDDSNVIHVSKLPHFSDLKFVGENNSLLDSNSILEEQVATFNDVATFQQYLK